MMMDMEVMHSSQQDMDLIDILWKQDIDLGARREVFDYNHRQKEYELQRQRELEEEKRLHVLQEQEEALLAQLQLDEETGEYIPRPVPSTILQSATTPLEVTQNVPFIEENNSGISFDECMQLLAETFPVEETEDTSVSLGSSSVSPNSGVMMSPEQPPLLPTTPSPAQLPPQKVSTDLEQAWMELLSLPELQQCMNMQMEDTLATNTYPSSSEVQNPNYTYYPMSEAANSVSACPPGYLNTFNADAPNVLPSDNLSPVDEPTANFNAEGFCDMFYPKNVVAESSAQPGFDEYESNVISDVPSNPPYIPMEMYSLSPGEAFDRDKPDLTAEMPDSDSGISNASPNASSPGKSVYGDGYGYSDSDMDDIDHNPGSAQSDYSEMFSLNFTPDDALPVIPVSIRSVQSPKQQEKNHKKRRTELAEESGHNRGPFTKDKLKKRLDVRLTRDEQRAKSLKIPFTVDMIINLPVDDFNELMSKHQLNEAQLALVRDIRRRGKNKVAAQNCRKRKMENIVGLESDLDSLKDEKERLLSEKSENLRNLKEMKKQLNSLYLEVFSLLKDEKGNSYSPSNYSLQQSTDGSIFLVPRIKKTFIKSEDNHLSH